MELLRVLGTNLTKYINESSYQVNPEKVYEEWMDANCKKHKSIFRTRAKGKFDLVFVTEADYNSFMGKIHQATNDNVLTAQFYVGGDVNAIQELNVYYDFKTSKHREISKTHIFNKVTMEIEEQ